MTLYKEVGRPVTTTTVPRWSFARLAGAVLLLGIADSMVGSYLVLYAANKVGFDPLQVGIFASAPAVGGIVVSSLVARRFDRHPSKLYAAAVCVVGAAGYALLTVTTSFWFMIVIAVVLLGAVSAAFPQLFALARLTLGDGAAGQRSAPLLRSGWSLAWAIGPLLGAALLAGLGYTSLLCGGVILLLATSVVAAALPTPPTERTEDAAEQTERTGDEPSPPRASTVFLLTVSVILFFTSMFAGSVAFPLYATRTLDQPDSIVGVLYSACAVVEILAALALAVLPAHISQRSVIGAAMVIFVGYFALTLAADNFAVLLVGQLARGIGIAIVGAAGIRYFQDLMAGRTGRATTLFSNATTAGSLISGVLAGLAGQFLGYPTTLALCGATAVVAAFLFIVASGRTSGPTPTAPPAG